MTVSDNELELLEEYLDGALDAPATAALNRRLVADSQLSTVVDRLKAQRVVRDAVWQSMESDTASADRLLWRVRGAVMDQRQTAARSTAPVARSAWNSWRIASFGSAAAACLVLGFFAGRAGQAGPAIQPSPMSVAANNANNNVVAVDLKQPQQGQFTRAGNLPQVLVPISNEYGQVVRWQPFDNAEQAKNFQEDLNHAQGTSVTPAPAGATKLASDEQVHF